MACSDFSSITRIPVVELLNGRIGELSNCRCEVGGLIEGVLDMRVEPVQCCFLLHPYIAMFLSACIPLFFIWLMSYCFRRYNGDIFVLQDMSQNSSGGIYKIKIDKNKNSIVILSKPSYEDLSEWSMGDIKAFYIHPTMFGFDWYSSKLKTSKTYYFGTLEGVKIRSEIEKLFAKFTKKNQ